MRLFFALRPPPATARALAEWAKEVARSAGGKPVAAEKIHLTLAFLGDADPGKASAVAQRVRGRAFDLPIEVSQYWKHNQIVWTGPAQIPEPLASLVEALRLELHRAGFALERRPFAAHITLLRKVRTPPTLPDRPPVRWHATEFALVQSRTSAAGPLYSTIKTFPMAGSQTTG